MDKRILIVDDEIPIAEILKINLEKEGYTVIQCFNGKDALEVNEKVHLWILDIMLGDEISGYDIIKKMAE